MSAEVMVDDAQCTIWINGQRIDNSFISRTDVDGIGWEGYSDATLTGVSS